nr:MAG TPA: hypothetical protein [Bacteriophage sp.]
MCYISALQNRHQFLSILRHKLELTKICEHYIHYLGIQEWFHDSNLHLLWYKCHHKLFYKLQQNHQLSTHLLVFSNPL